MLLEIKSGIIDLLNLVNGKIRTPKFSQLHKLIDWVSENPRYNRLIGESLVKLSLDTCPLNTNAWLSVFSEGDSSFQIRITEGLKYNHLSTTYEISPSRLNSELFESYKEIMESIAQLFLAKLGIVYLSQSDRSGKQPYWRARNTSQVGAKEVIKYFNKYPLFSSKHLEFLCWSEAHNLIEIKAHHKKYGLASRFKKIKLLKNRIMLNVLNFHVYTLKKIILSLKLKSCNLMLLRYRPNGCWCLASKLVKASQVNNII